MAASEMRSKLMNEMFTDELKHELGSYLEGQGRKLLNRQVNIFDATYRNRTGALSTALHGSPQVNGLEVTMNYPLHIRFLDMKKGPNGRRKKRYAAIYNKYVYGYLKADVWKTLNRAIPGQMVKAISETFK